MYPVVFDVGEVPVLDCSSAGIVDGAAVHVFGQAVDVERGAPSGRVATVEPARGIKLHLHEPRPRMLADVMRVGGVAAIEDVPVAGRSTENVGSHQRTAWVGSGLIVAHRHAKPEGGMQHEIEYAPGAVLIGRSWRVFWQPQTVNLRGSRTWDV